VHEIFLWVLVRGSVSGTGRKLKCEIRQPASGRTRGAASNMTQGFSVFETDDFLTENPLTVEEHCRGQPYDAAELLL
jgi:hypothetical protein